MKKAILYAIILVGIWSISSCKKETSIENPVSQVGNFTAKIDGVQWTAALTSEQATILGGVINITGISANNQEISITLNNDQTGNYTLNQASLSLAAYADIDSSDLYAFTTNEGADTTQAGGQVTILKIDSVQKTISGTFSFKVYRDLDGRGKTITSGVFTSLPYTNKLPPASITDTLNATIDGMPWAGQSIEASVSAGELSIVGSSTTGAQSIGLLMPSTATAGSYPLDGSNPYYMGLYTVLQTSTASGLVSNKGTLTILSNNTTTSRIRGNFQFTAVDPTGTSTATHTIASGLFSVYYGK
jgi:hypothetical protein